VSARIDRKQLEMWKQGVLNALHREVDKLSDIQQTHIPITHRYITKQHITKLHDNYVFTNTDKFINNYSITSKTHWLQQLYDTTINPTQKTYKIVQHVTEKQVINRHIKYLTEWKLEGRPNLPRKYNNSKQHKDGWRPICAAPAATTTNLSKMLTVALDAVMSSANKQTYTYDVQAFAHSSTLTQPGTYENDSKISMRNRYMRQERSTPQTSQIGTTPHLYSRS